jgi:hypothetical protein
MNIYIKLQDGKVANVVGGPDAVCPEGFIKFTGEGLPEIGKPLGAPPSAPVSIVRKGASKSHAARRSAYPTVQAQLDMLWHGMNEDPSKRVEPFYSNILAIKAQFPNTTEDIDPVEEVSI